MDRQSPSQTSSREPTPSDATALKASLYETALQVEADTKKVAALKKQFQDQLDSPTQPCLRSCSCISSVKRGRYAEATCEAHKLTLRNSKPYSEQLGNQIVVSPIRVPTTDYYQSSRPFTSDNTLSSALGPLLPKSPTKANPARLRGSKSAFSLHKNWDDVDEMVSAHMLPSLSSPKLLCKPTDSSTDAAVCLQWLCYSISCCTHASLTVHTIGVPDAFDCAGSPFVSSTTRRIGYAREIRQTHSAAGPNAT